MEGMDVENTDASQQHGLAGSSPPERRLSIVLDAANVCWQFVKSQPGWTTVQSGPRVRPPVTGLTLTIKFWRQYGVEPVAICPAWWAHVSEQGLWGTLDWEAHDFAELEGMRRAGLLYSSPSGEHDDLYLLDMAFRTDGFLVSNDRYRDHHRERNLDWDWIESRRIGFMFVRTTFLPNPDSLLRLEAYCSEARICLNQPPSLNIAPQPLPIVSLTTGGVENETLALTQHRTTVREADAMPHQARAGLQAEGAAPPRVARDSLQIPSRAAGFVIGRSGQTIQGLQQESGCRISIDKQYGSSEGSRTVQFVGTRKSVDHAKRLVQDLVEVHHSRRSTPSLSRSDQLPISSSEGSNKSQPSTPALRIARSDPVGVPYMAHQRIGQTNRAALDMEDDDDDL